MPQGLTIPTTPYYNCSKSFEPQSGFTENWSFGCVDWEALQT